MPPETVTADSAVTHAPVKERRTPGFVSEPTAPDVGVRRRPGGRPRRSAGSRVFTIARRILGLAILLFLWQFLPTWHVIDPRYVIKFSEVCSTWWGLLRDGTLWEQTGPSLLRIFVGFFAAIAIGVPLGAAIAWYRPVRETATPVLEIFRNTAPLAILPVFTLILGIGNLTKYVMVGYACLPPVVLSTVTGISGVDEQLIRTARVLGLSPIATFRKVAFPASLPSIFTGIRIAGAAAVLVLLAAEMVGATAGLGYFINSSEMNFQVPDMYAGIITVTMVGLAINYGLQWLQKRVTRGARTS